MQRLSLAFLALLSCTALAKDADKVILDAHYSCLNTVVSGLNWENGRWVPHAYAPLGMFQMEIMIVETTFTGGIKHQLIHFTTEGDSQHSHCGAEFSPSLDPEYSCTQLGRTIVFSDDASRGGISMLLGSESTEDSRDTLSVAPFTCQKR